MSGPPSPALQRDPRVGSVTRCGDERDSPRTLLGDDDQRHHDG